MSALYAAILVAMALIGSGLRDRAWAQEYCIACTEPRAVYRCVIGDARYAKGQPLPQFCASTLARDGQHASCAVRGGTVFDCDGPIRRVALPPQEQRAQEKHTPGQQQTQVPAQDPAKDAPPETAAQMAARITRSSGEQIEKTGSAVGGSAKKAWNCLTSFFKSC